MSTMIAVVPSETGDPEKLKLRNVPIPVAKRGEVPIRVKAFGFNRAEMFTRQGHTPDVTVPRFA